MDLLSIEKQVIGAQELNTINIEKLYQYLEINTQYSKWVDRRIEKYNFIENEDYIKKIIQTQGRPKVEYHISLDMAKELCMVENNAKGREARRYFIEVEKQYRNHHNGKNINHIIAGYQSQIAQHNNKINELTKELNKLKSEQKLLPHKTEEESFFIKAKRLAKRDKEKMTNLTEIVQYHLGVCIEYIEALRVGGSELQKLTIEKIKKAEDERTKARELQSKADFERNLLKKKVDEYILVSNELLRVRHRE